MTITVDAIQRACEEQEVAGLRVRVRVNPAQHEECFMLPGFVPVQTYSRTMAAIGSEEIGVALIYRFVEDGAVPAGSFRVENY